MTKKDYILLANTIKDTWRHRLMAHKHVDTCVCVLMANALEKENPRFSRGKFLTACMPEEDACEVFKLATGYPKVCANCGVAKAHHGE